MVSRSPGTSPLEVYVALPGSLDVETVEHIDQVLPWLVAQGLFVTERGV